MKKFVLMAMVAALVVPAMAAPTDLQVTITSTSEVSWPSLPYNVTVGAGDWSSYQYAAGDTFQTFCIEWNREFGHYGRTDYWATVDDVIRHGGASTGQIPVAPTDQSRQIYAAFLNGHIDASANDIQREIWWWEAGQTTVTVGSTTTYNFDIFASLTEESQYAGWQYVRVLNLWENADLSGRDVQSQLVMVTPIPAPGAILLTGIGTSLVGWLRRRRSL